MNPQDQSQLTAGLGWIILCVFIYFLPAFVGAIRGKRNAIAILMLTVFLGWTFVGWVIALVWSCMAEPDHRH